MKASNSKQQQPTEEEHLNGDGNHKRFRSNFVIAKNDCEEEVLNLNPISFSKITNAHLVYKPVGARTEESDHEEELVLNPNSLGGDLSDVQSAQYHLNWRTFGGLVQEEPADRRSVELQVEQVDDCSAKSTVLGQQVVAKLSGEPTEAAKKIAVGEEPQDTASEEPLAVNRSRQSKRRANEIRRAASQTE